MKLWPIWVTALVLGLAFAGCSGDDDDDDDGGGHLVYAIDFESPDDASALGARVLADDPASAFVPGLDGNAFALTNGNQLVVPAAGRIPRDRGTLMFWVQPRSVWHDDRERQIFAVGDEANFSFTKDGLKNKPVFIVNGSGVTPQDERPVLDYYGFTIRKPYLWRSGWTHVAVTWSGLGERTTDAVRRLYIDGALVAETIGPAADFDTDAPIIIGALRGGADADALIDALRIYDDAWSAEDVAAAGFRADVQRQYTLAVVPEPQPYGWNPGEGFLPDAATVIAVPPDQRSELADLVGFVQDAIENAYGARPVMVDSTEAGGVENVIAVGTLAGNGALRAMDAAWSLPASDENLGADGYLLDIREAGIAVAAADGPGIRHGLTSLLRVVNQHGGKPLPPVTLADRPDFPIRGAEIPGLYPLNDESRRRIRYLGELKLTHLLIPGDFYFDLDNDFVRENAAELFAFVRAHGMEPVPAFAWYGEADRVIAECNALGYDCAEGDSDDTCPLVEDIYGDILEPMLANIRDVLAPAAVHIGHRDIRRFNENPECVAAGWSPAELYAYSVGEVTRRVRSTMPDAQVMVWADMIASMHNGARLAAPAPGSEEPPPSVYDLIPKDSGITWCAYRYNESPLLAYVYAFATFAEFTENGVASFVGGPGGEGVDQAVMWMKNADDFDAPGFIGRPSPDTSEDFADPLWQWLPASSEAAWSLWSPETDFDLGYTYQDLNAAYGSF